MLGSYGGAGRVGYIGEGGFDCGSKQLSASPMAASFGTFLTEVRKVHNAYMIAERYTFQ